VAAAVLAKLAPERTAQDVLAVLRPQPVATLATKAMLAVACHGLQLHGHRAARALQGALPCCFRTLADTTAGDEAETLRRAIVDLVVFLAMAADPSDGHVVDTAVVTQLTDALTTADELPLRVGAANVLITVATALAPPLLGRAMVAWMDSAIKVLCTDPTEPVVTRAVLQLTFVSIQRSGPAGTPWHEPVVRAVEGFVSHADSALQVAAVKVLGAVLGAQETPAPQLVHLLTTATRECEREGADLARKLLTVALGS